MKLAAGHFHSLCQTVQVAFVERVEQGLLVREVLVHGADRDPGALGDPRGRQTMCSLLDQNLNGGFENRIDCRAGTGLTRRFAGFEMTWWGDVHMQIKRRMILHIFSRACSQYAKVIYDG